MVVTYNEDTITNQIDFDSDRIVIVHYKPNSGGKFLINCLGLTDNAVFQDAVLVHRQLKNEFDVTAKLNFLIEKLEDTQAGKTWNDLALGCKELFGIATKEYLSGPLELKKYWNINQAVQRAIDNDKYLFLVSHSNLFLKRAMEVWPNARVVVFDNCDYFIHHKRRFTTWPVLPTIWDNIRDETWTSNPPMSFEEYYALPDSVKDNLEDRFGDYYLQQLINYFRGLEDVVLKEKTQLEDQELAEIIKHKNVQRWSTKWYFNQDDCVKQLRQLANTLGIADIDYNAVVVYYNKYMESLHKQNVKHGLE